MMVNRAHFIAGSAALAGGALSVAAEAAEPMTAGMSPDASLRRLMVGNKRFVNNNFPSINKVAEKRALLVEGQSPFASILSCADSRVIPELIFVAGIGELFVTRVAGNVADDLVVGSLEYAVENLGTSLIMVLGHQGCGAVKAVYKALEQRTRLPKHLDAIEELIAPGISEVVKAGGSIDAAIEANARAASTALATSEPVLSRNVAVGKLRIVAGVYHLRSGEVTLIE